MADCICATILLVINPVTQLRLETGRGIVTPLILKEFLGVAAKGFIESGEVRTSRTDRPHCRASKGTSDTIRRQVPNCHFRFPFR